MHDTGLPDFSLWGRVKHAIEAVDKKANTVYDVVAGFGAVGDGVTDDTDAIEAAIAAADAEADATGRTQVVYFPPGTYLTDTISLSGRDVVLWGAGPGSTRFVAKSDISGYVIDMDGWAAGPGSAHGMTPFGNFAVWGTGNADATKAQGGVRCEGAGGFDIRNITVKQTGGPAWFCGAGMSLGEFSHITLFRPVGADTNDVPYLHIKGWHNGNTWNRLGLRSQSTDADGTAAVKIEAVTPVAHDTIFRDPWLEFLHTPDGGSVFEVEANKFIFDQLQSFDSGSAVENPIDNCVFRNRGTGNRVYGQIPGRGQSTVSYTYGIIDEGSRNFYLGSRGFRDNNIKLASGVVGTFALLGGSDSGAEGVGGSAFDDQSGQPGKNWLVDFSLPNANSGSIYTPTNVSTDRSYDANSTTVAELADVLGTLISDLQTRGLIG